MRQLKKIATHEPRAGGSTARREGVVPEATTEEGLHLALEDVPENGLRAHLRRGNLFAADCPSRDVLKHVTSRWGVLVLVALLDGKLRFSELRRKVRGVSERMLAQTLQWLEADGLVLRTAYQVVPPHVDYQLTPMGEEAARKLEVLVDWIEDNLSAILATRAHFEEAQQA